MHASKVTIAIPTHNRADLLRGALASALAQDFHDFRVIVLDNASSDDTKAVVFGFNDPRVGYAPSHRNIGCTRNLNRAIAIANSPYVTILMDDDLLRPGFLSASVGILDDHPEAAFSFTAARYIDMEGRPLRARHSRDVPAGVLSGLDYLELHANVRECWIEPSTVLVRTAAAAAAGGFDSPHSRHSDDLNLWLRLAARCAIAHVPEPLVDVRVHAGQLSAGAFRARGYGNYGTIAERIDGATYLLESPRASDAAYRGWLANRLRSLHRSQSAQLYALIPDLYYPNDERLEIAGQEIAALVPGDETLILVDEGDLVEELALARHVVPFLEADGVYAGLPPDDATAIRELTRLRDQGAGFIVFAWPAFWWLDYYAGFRAHLTANYPRPLSSSRIIAFDLRQPIELPLEAAAADVHVR
jgi:glycosyltransferase involved in cell wall biosynthesis